eukprot:scaffold2606_cov16-Tisochrysis_lutea.AAC.1
MPFRTDLVGGQQDKTWSSICACSMALLGQRQALFQSTTIMVSPCTSLGGDPEEEPPHGVCPCMIMKIAKPGSSSSSNSERMQPATCCHSLFTRKQQLEWSVHFA